MLQCKPVQHKVRRVHDKVGPQGHPPSLVGDAVSEGVVAADG